MREALISRIEILSSNSPHEISIGGKLVGATVSLVEAFEPFCKCVSASAMSKNTLSQSPLAC